MIFKKAMYKKINISLSNTSMQQHRKLHFTNICKIVTFLKFDMPIINYMNNKRLKIY